MTKALARPSKSECLWCGRTFAPGRSGSPKRFCGAGHRGAFHTAARRFAERAIAAGTVSISALKGGDLQACTPVEDAASAEIGRLVELVDEALAVDETAALGETVELLLQLVAALREENETA